MLARRKFESAASVLRQEGALQMVKLAAISLMEPIHSLRLRKLISADARRAAAKLRSTGGRGLFVDCGANIGQSYAYFSEYYQREHFDYILIEPNPRCLPFLEKLCSDDIEIIGKAASTRKGSARLFGPPLIRNEPTHQGLSLIAEHNASLYESAETGDTVETFSLSELVLTKRNSYKLIVLKMDVEGAEYQILEDLVATGAHRELFAAYIEFHSRYMNNTDRVGKRAAEDKIKRALQGEKVIVREWI